MLDSKMTRTRRVSVKTSNEGRQFGVLISKGCCWYVFRVSSSSEQIEGPTLERRKITRYVTGKQLFGLMDA